MVCCNHLLAVKDIEETKNSIIEHRDIFLNRKAEKLALLICEWTKSKGILKVRRAPPEYLSQRGKGKTQTLAFSLKKLTGIIARRYRL